MKFIFQTIYTSSTFSFI